MYWIDTGPVQLGPAVQGNRIEFILVNEFEECTEELAYSDTIDEERAVGDLTVTITCIGFTVSTTNLSGSFEAERI